MSKILHLIAKETDTRDIRGPVGLLCEFAPDSPSICRAEHSCGPDVLLGSADAALREVYPLVSKVLENSPSIDGFQPLRVFEEPLLEQFSYLAQTLHLDRWISHAGFSRCCFTSYAQWLDRLRVVREITGSEYEIVSGLSALDSTAHRRALRRLWKSRPGFAELSRRVIPLGARYISGLGQRSVARAMKRGGIWFYSTAYTFTKIGVEYEPYLPETMNYLVEDLATGGRRVREAGRHAHALYAWSRPADIPSSAEIRVFGNAITASIASLPLSATESILRDAFLKSEWWRLFLMRLLPFVIFNSRVLQRWYRSVAPEMILVGNSSYERALLLHENVRQVPVVMLQHGIMHWVYAVSDEPVDIFLLRGPFFQRVISEKLRRKTVIHNLPQPKQAAGAGGKVRDTILFITAPYAVAVLFHEEDRRDILRSLLRVAHATRRRLVIRVHPMEKVSLYERSVADLQRELGLRADVSYSQGPGAEELLARSCVAVLFFSTMFLDCLRHGVPIVSFDWHWFGNKDQFKKEKIFNFAGNLAEFEALVKKGVDGNLSSRQSGLEEFLVPNQAEDLSRFFREIWESRKSLSYGVVPSIA